MVDCAAVEITGTAFEGRAALDGLGRLALNLDRAGLVPAHQASANDAFEIANRATT